MDLTEKQFKERVKKAVKPKRIVINRPDLTLAAVLVPIVFRNKAPCLILTKRTMTVATHKGQISFPGGVREPEDRNEIENALRETTEEIGITSDTITVVGMLDDYATITGFAVTPVVGFVATDAVFKIDPVEVAELIEVPIIDMMKSENHEFVTETGEAFCYQYHKYKVGGRLVWGATAGILHGLFTAIDEVDTTN